MAPKGPHLPKQMRERMVVWKVEMGKSTAEIAELAGCCERAVRNILSFEREYGVVNNPLAQAHSGPRILDTRDIDYISSLIHANPVLYLDEIQDQLLQYRNLEVSLATVSRALRRIALTHKKISSEAVERNELLRATWQAAYADIPAEYCVWLDESSVDNRTNQRTSGWAEVGRACVRRELFIRGQRFSVLPAFTCDGYIALDIFEGSVNKEKFIRFLEEQVVSFQFVSEFIALLIFVILW
jgi:transposase